MSTERALFDEWSAVLQFPYYFGYNWPALGECCADLSWLPNAPIVVGIIDANRYSGTEHMLGALTRALANAAAELGKKTEWQEARGFRVVLQVDSDMTIVSRFESLGFLAQPFAPSSRFG